jgi:hypothetical protein
VDNGKWKLKSKEGKKINCQKIMTVCFLFGELYALGFLTCSKAKLSREAIKFTFDRTPWTGHQHLARSILIQYPWKKQTLYYPIIEFLQFYLKS